MLMPVDCAVFAQPSQDKGQGPAMEGRHVCRPFNPGKPLYDFEWLKRSLCKERAQ